MRLKQEKESQGVHLKVEESKAVRARLDLAYDELADMVAKSSSERSTLEQLHADEIRAISLEKDATIAAYKEQIEALIAAREGTRGEVETLKEAAASASEMVGKYQTEASNAKLAQSRAEDGLRLKIMEVCVRACVIYSTCVYLF